MNRHLNGGDRPFANSRTRPHCGPFLPATDLPQKGCQSTKTEVLIQEKPSFKEHASLVLLDREFDATIPVEMWSPFDA